MKSHSKWEVIAFFGVLIVVGAAVFLSVPYIKAEPSLQIVNHFVQATSTPGEQAAATSTPAPSIITQIVNLFTGGSSAPSSTSPSAPSSTPVVSTPPPPPPPAQTPPATTAGAPAVQEKTLPYSVGTFNNGFETGDGWINWWGSSSEAKGVLSVYANASSTGGGTLLAGSDWTNLTFLATVDWEQGETFGIVAHYIDNNNYLVCQFDEKNVGDMHLRLDEHVDGVVTHLADGDIFNYEEMGGANIPAAIQISGNEGACAFDGYTISSLYSSRTIDPSLSHGEIGFTTWDPNLDNSVIVVQNVGVTQTIYNLGTNAQQTSE